MYRITDKKFWFLYYLYSCWWLWDEDFEASILADAFSLDVNYEDENFIEYMVDNGVDVERLLSGSLTKDVDYIMRTLSENYDNYVWDKNLEYFGDKNQKSIYTVSLNDDISISVELSQGEGGVDVEYFLNDATKRYKLGDNSVYTRQAENLDCEPNRFYMTASEFVAITKLGDRYDGFDNGTRALLFYPVTCTFNDEERIAVDSIFSKSLVEVCGLEYSRAKETAEYLSILKYFENDDFTIEKEDKDKSSFFCNRIPVVRLLMKKGLSLQ